MQTTDKNELRELKNRVVQQLQATQWDYKAYAKVDARLGQYIKACVANPDAHNLYELLALLRFERMRQKYELWAMPVQRFILVYESLKFPAEGGPTKFKLTPIQVFQFTNILGFYHVGTERRVTTEALLFVPRKFSKTTSVASLAVYDLIFGDANAQSYVAANSYDQAQICFRVIRNVVKGLDPKLKRFKVNREQIFSLQKGRSSFSRCLASDADKLDGLEASVVIVDEYAQSDTAELKNVLTSSMGSRRNPLTITITTASTKRETPFMDELNAYKAILRGELENDSIFAHIFEPDVDDDEGDPNTWRKVQPHLGITCREDFYQDKWAKAHLTKDNMVEFRTKLLNIFTTDAKSQWLKAEQIESAFLAVPIDSLRQVRAVCSVDLSVMDDFSAVTYTLFLPGRVLPGRTTECPFHSITDYYLPQARLHDHPNREVYQRWAAAGFLKVCKGDMIDYQQIVGDMLAKPFSILGVGYDPYKSLEFVKLLEYTPGVGKGYLYPIAQTYGNFTSPVEMFELSLIGGRLSIDPNPITAYCFANATLDEDRLENRKPTKIEENMKIDGAITNVMNMWMLNNIKIIR